MSVQADEERLDRIETSLDALSIILAELLAQIEIIQEDPEDYTELFDDAPTLIESDLYGQDCHFRIDEQIGITGSIYSSYSEGLLLTCRDTVSESWEFREQFDECTAAVTEIDGRLQTVIRCW